MTQIDTTTYSVTVGENVTVEVQAFHTGNFVQVFLNGAEKQPSTLNPPTFVLPMAGANGIDSARVSCQFANEAPDNAHYQLFFTGSGGGGKFTGSDIIKVSAVWHADISFISDPALLKQLTGGN